MKKYGFGIDVGGTTVKIGLFRDSGEIIDKWEIPTVTENGGEQIFSDIASAIESKLSEKSIDKASVIGVGMGIPGPVINESYVINAVNLGWKEINVSNKLSELINLPVKVTNDANAAALGEMWQGAAKNSENLIFVTLGTGVGGAIIVGGKVVEGSTGASGEIGHMCVNFEETKKCNCGSRGCLEQYVSATGIAKMGKAKLGYKVTAKEIFDKAKSGDIDAIEIVEKFGRILGRTLGQIACVVNPESIVIGGGVSKAGTIILDVIQKNFFSTVFFGCRKVSFSIAELENDAGMYGAMRLLL